MGERKGRLVWEREVAKGVLDSCKQLRTLGINEDDYLHCGEGRGVVCVAMQTFKI
jgi:hypothetical protein